MSLTPQEVIATFSRLTGIKLRVAPHSVQRQAADFIKHGFTLEEMEIVIMWIKRQIREGRSGFTEASYSWKNLFGDHGAADEFLKFQERLGLAENDRERGRWKPKLSTAAPAAEPVRAPAKPAPAPDAQEAGAIAAEAAAGLKQWMLSQQPTHRDKAAEL